MSGQLRKKKELGSANNVSISTFSERLAAPFKHRKTAAVFVNKEDKFLLKNFITEIRVEFRNFNFVF